MFNLQEKGPATYVLPQEGGMRVPGLVIATPELMQEVDIERPLEQVRNVAHLPGMVGYSIAMPDIHWGYGFPIGGVAAMDPNEGVISPGGVGYDINCGVRVAVVPIRWKDVDPKHRRKLIQRIFQSVPSGVGKGHKSRKELSDGDYQKLLTQGARWSVERGLGFADDLDATESYGCISGADPSAVSPHAKDRGRDQLGTLGSGNHFLEVGEFQKPYLPDIAEAWGIEEGMTYLLIHSGSRGLGHQVCQDTLNTFVKQGFAEGLPDRQLVAAPINSSYGQTYIAAMSAAANFAFNNRQQMLHMSRQAFKEVLGVKPEAVRLLYDVCHNIAKFEHYEVDGKMRKLCVHRKGATRAFGPGHEELADRFKKTGQPVMVPGDMGRASHILVGQGNPLTWCSCCHGAGRSRSRHQSRKAWQGRDPVRHMDERGVTVMATSTRTIDEEMPDAYKNVDVVVEAVEEAGLARRVLRLKPHLVIKG